MTINQISVFMENRAGQMVHAMGDVEQEVFDDFISKLDHEIDYEN